MIEYCTAPFQTLGPCLCCLIAVAKYFIVQTVDATWSILYGGRILKTLAQGFDARMQNTASFYSNLYLSVTV